MQRTRIAKQSSFNALFDPPGSVSAEASAPLGIEIIDGFDQAEISLFDQIAKAHAAIAVTFCDIDDEPEVGADKLLSGMWIVVFDDTFCKGIFFF